MWFLSSYFIKEIHVALLNVFKNILNNHAGPVLKKIHVQKDKLDHKNFECLSESIINRNYHTYMNTDITIKHRAMKKQPVIKVSMSESHQ